MEVIIRPDADEACTLVADLIAGEIRNNPKLVVGLATGRTMERVYSLLVKKYKKGHVDFAHVTTFNLDEYIGLALDHPNSFHAYMDDHLFRHVNIHSERTHIPNGEAKDLEGECLAYEETIRGCGGIDLQLLGIGQTGHIGFNEPISALRSRTRTKALTPQTLKQNAHLFDDPDAMPRRAITMGVGTILDSKRCVLLATGEKKAAIVAKAVEGPVTSMISASALQLHPRCTVVVDEEAAGCLENTEYYRWLFENEPEWERFRR